MRFIMNNMLRKNRFLSAHDAAFKQRLTALCGKNKSSISLAPYNRSRVCTADIPNTNMAHLERWINASQVHNTQRHCPMLNGRIAPRGPSSQPWGSLGLRWRSNPIVEIGYLDALPSFDQFSAHQINDNYISKLRTKIQCMLKVAIEVKFLDDCINTTGRWKSPLVPYHVTWLPH